MKRNFALIVLFMAAFCWLAPSSFAEQDEGFSFVQITDLHFGEPANETRTRRVVDAINALPLPVEFVAVTGDLSNDLTDDGHTLTNVLAILSRLRAPVHFVAGNHDILRKRMAPTLAVYTNLVGPLCQALEVRGVNCVFVYTEPLRKDFHIAGYDPLACLEEHLRAAGGKPSIVFTHAPSTGDFYGNRMHKGWPEENTALWQALLNRHDVRGVLTGHFHRDELHWLGNVPLFVCAPISKEYGRVLTYRIYEFRNGRLGYRTQYVD